MVEIGDDYFQYQDLERVSPHYATSNQGVKDEQLVLQSESSDFYRQNMTQHQLMPRKSDVK